MNHGLEDSPEYNFFATNVMERYGGPPVANWRRQLNERLPSSQATEGPDSGSWKPIGGEERPFGRLETTVYNLMALEVYYRYRSLYVPDKDARPLAEDARARPAFDGSEFDPGIRLPKLHPAEDLPTIDLNDVLKELEMSAARPPA